MHAWAPPLLAMLLLSALQLTLSALLILGLLAQVCRLLLRKAVFYWVR